MFCYAGAPRRGWFMSGTEEKPQRLGANRRRHTTKSEKNKHTQRFSDSSCDVRRQKLADIHIFSSGGFSVVDSPRVA